jgi:hypothetical protein
MGETQMTTKTILDAERERQAVEDKSAVDPIEAERARPSTGATLAGAGFSAALGRAGKGPDDIYRTTGIDPTTADGRPRTKP